MASGWLAVALRHLGSNRARDRMVVKRKSKALQAVRQAVGQAVATPLTLVVFVGVFCVGSLTAKKLLVL